VRYAEIFFDPQSHLERGTALEDVIEGLHSALEVEGPKGDRQFTGRLIMSFLRDWKVDN